MRLQPLFFFEGGGGVRTRYPAGPGSYHCLLACFALCLTQFDPWYLGDSCLELLPNFCLDLVLFSLSLGTVYPISVLD